MRCEEMSDPAPVCDFPGEEEQMYYKLYRDRIEHEDQLIHYRLSWLLVTQTLLFGIWASVSFQKDRLVLEPVPKGIAFFVLGFLMCLTAYAGIWAALLAIR